MFAARPRPRRPFLFAFLATTVLVFSVGIGLAPELTSFFAPLCMAILAMSYPMFLWLEKQ